MITESYHEYKGFKFKLRAVTGNGFWYKIYKEIPNSSSPDGIKKIWLREKGWSFIEPNELMQKAKNYIDNFTDELNKKFIDRTSP